MKVYLDENLSPDIARLLRSRGIDAISAHEAGQVQVDDRTQLRYATEHGRAIATSNVVDFVELAAEAVRANEPHAGIILIPSSFRTDDFPRIARGIELVARQYAAGLAHTVVYLSQARR